jgi:hypothetical protein
MRPVHLQSGGRYPVLRSIGILYLVMAGISVIVGLIAAGYILASQPWNIWSRVVWAIVTIAGTFFAVLACLAIAEVLKLFIDIEHNSRMYGSREMTSEASPSVSSAAPSDSGRRNRLCEIDEETAETALLRGH